MLAGKWCIKKNEIDAFVVYFFLIIVTNLAKRNMESVYAEVLQNSLVCFLHVTI